MRYLIIALVAGMITGLGSIILKSLVGGSEILSLFFNPIFIFSIFMGASGFFLSQFSLKKEKSSHVTLAATSSTNFIVILGSYFLLKEIISLWQFMGVILILLSAFILIAKS